MAFSAPKPNGVTNSSAEPLPIPDNIYSHSPWLRIYLGQIKDSKSKGGYSHIWMGFSKDAKSGENIELLYRQKTRGHPCGWNLINNIIATTVPEELKGGTSFKHKAIDLAEETWGERKTTGELALEKKRWIRMHKKEQDEEGEETEGEDENGEFDDEAEEAAGASQAMVPRKRHKATPTSVERVVRGSKKAKTQLASFGAADITLRVALRMGLKDILRSGKKASAAVHQVS